jgi:hypothetical protein
MALWKNGAIIMLAVSPLFPLIGLVLVSVLVSVLVLDLVVIRRIAPLPTL